MRNKTLMKTLSALLAVLMVLCSAPLSGFVGLKFPEIKLPEWNLFDFSVEAEAFYTENGFIYEVNNGEATLIGCTETGDIVIPSTLGGYPVKNIGRAAFHEHHNITSVVISDSVTCIGDQAFERCTNLVSVTIPDSVTSVGDYVFWDCTSLQTMVIGDNVTSIGHKMFYNCTSLMSVTIGDSVTSIGTRAFRDCCSLMSVIIPDSVTIIGGEAFYNCINLTSVTIGKNVKNITESAFYNCASLEMVHYKGDIESWLNINFLDCYANPKFYAKKLYINNTLIKEIVIPDTVTEIKNFAFSGFEDITSIAIPDSVTNIGFGAFSDCTSLTSIEIPDSVTGIGYYAFYGCASLTSVTIGNSVTSIGNNAFYNCTGLKELTMPVSVNIYNSPDTFYNCTNIEKVILTKGTGVMRNFGTSTSSYATEMYYEYTPWYMSKNSIKEIIIKDGVMNIGSYVFIGLSNITKITIPDSVTSIGDWSFYGTSLTSVTIGNGIKSIGYNAFCKCNDLARVYYTGDIESWCGIEFDYNSNPMVYARNFYIDNTLIKELVIPDTVVKIKDYAFYSFEGINSVTIPDSVTSIGDSAFSDCGSLTSVTIGSSVTSIDVSAFAHCDSLTSVTMGNCVVRIGDCAFVFCDSLTDVYYTGDIKSWLNIEFDSSNSNPMCFADNIYFNGEVIENVIIPDDVTAIKSDVFRGFKCLKTVTIPENVITIRENAFYGCRNIEKVFFEGTESQWEEIAIYDGNDCLVNAEITFLDGGHEHSYTSSVSTEPTCIEEGVKTFKCGCGDTYTEVIPATGHTWSKWIVATEPTEISDGLRVRFCNVCEDVVESEVIPATGHEWSAWETTTEPTMTTDGVKTRTCSVCNKTEIGVVPKTGITATLTDAEGNVVKAEIISGEMTEITFGGIDNGTYTLTLSKETYATREYQVTVSNSEISASFSLNKTGDINGDGKVNTIDVARANTQAKGVSELADYELACADVNGDGKVNTIDVARINSHAKGVSTLW